MPPGGAAGEGSGSAGASRPAARRAILLLGTSLLVHAALPSAALAQEQCGPPPPGGGTVTCDPGGNPYPDGIEYADPVDDLTIVLEHGVVVTDTLVAIANAAGVDLRLEGGIDTSIATTGNESHGVVVDAQAGSAYVALDEISTSGEGAAGIIVRGADGATVLIDSVTTSGASYQTLSSYVHGVHASGGGSVTVTSGNISIGGDLGFGIRVDAYGDATIASTSIVTEGHGGHGMQVLSQTGAIDITSGTIRTGGVRAIGILAANGPGSTAYLPPDISITSTTVTTAGDGANGILATTEEGDIFIESGAVTTTGTRTEGGGEHATGITAFTRYGSVQIESGTVSTGGDFADGIMATSSGSPYQGGGAVLVTSDSVTTTGAYSQGIEAFGQAGVTIDSGIVRTTGTESAGIGAASTDGGVSVTSDQLSTEGAASAGIFAYSRFGSVEVTNTDLVQTGGVVSIGIFARSQYASVTIDSGTVITGGDFADGIYARGFDDVVVTSDVVSTTGSLSIGIEARAVHGDLIVTSGEVATTGAGIIGGAAGTVTIASNIVVTTGDDATGIFATEFGAADGNGDAIVPGAAAALGPNGGITINSGSITTSGANSAGIDALAAAGDIEIFSTGAVATSGANAPGIRAVSEAGFVAVDVNGVNVAGAGSDAIVVDSATTSTLIVRGPVQSADGFSLQANGGAAAVSTTASGTIRGRVDLTDNADTLDNAGTFDAIGASAFGAGADTFDNSGTTRSVNGAAVLGGLETFDNGGLVDLGDGAPDDRLTIGGFNGLPGSRLAVDVDFTARVADVLVTGVASGSTTVAINASGAQFAFNTTGILVVDATAGTPSTAFSLAGGNVSNGYVTSGLIFDASNFNFLLVNAPNQPIFETAMVGGMTLDYWHQGADAVEAQLEGARAPGRGSGAGNLVGGGRLGGWLQVFAGETEREATQSFTSGGASTTFDVSYEQDFEGIQAGVDHESGPVILGLTVGVGQSESRFEASPGALEMDAKNLGLYLAFASGNFYLNVLAKVDWMDLETNPGPGLAAAFDATAYGARGVAGFRFDLGNLYLEPSVGLSWVTVDIDDYRSGGATISFDEATSLRGTAGLRIGGTVATGGDGVLSPFAGLRLVEEFGGANRNDFFLGTNLNLTEDGPGTHGEASVGLTFTAGSVEAFIRGELDFGNDVEGRAVRGGVRLRF